MDELLTWIPSLVALAAFLGLTVLPVAHHAGRRHYSHTDRRRFHC